MTLDSNPILICVKTTKINDLLMLFIDIFEYCWSFNGQVHASVIYNIFSNQVDLHKKCFDTANNQGFDRLADNHFGHNLGGADLTPYINAQKAAGLPYRFYTGKFFYLYAPNGWGVQLIGTCTGCPSSGGYG